jgi:hypothetical protein
MASDGHHSDTECNEEDGNIMAEGTPVGTNDGEEVEGTRIIVDTSQDKAIHSSQSNLSPMEEDLSCEDNAENALPPNPQSTEASSPSRGTGEGGTAIGNSTTDNTSKGRVDRFSQIEITHMEAVSLREAEPGNIIASNWQGTEARSPEIGIEEGETVAGSSEMEDISTDKVDGTSQTDTEESRSSEGVSRSSISVQNTESSEEATFTSRAVESDDEPSEESDSGNEDTSSSNEEHYADSAFGQGYRFFDDMPQGVGYKHSICFLSLYPTSLLRFFLHLLMKPSWIRDDRKLRQAREIGLISIGNPPPAMLTETMKTRIPSSPPRILNTNIFNFTSKSRPSAWL